MSGLPPVKDASHGCKRHSILELLPNGLSNLTERQLWPRSRQAVRWFAKLLLSISGNGRQGEQEATGTTAARTSAPPFFPPASKLDPKRKAEMDYQAELDRRKAAEQFSYSRRGIILDKGIFGLLIAAVT
jgi:hypothetical protein